MTVLPARILMMVVLMVAALVSACDDTNAGSVIVADGPDNVQDINNAAGPADNDNVEEPNHGLDGPDDINNGAQEPEDDVPVPNDDINNGPGPDDDEPLQPQGPVPELGLGEHDWWIHAGYDQRSSIKGLLATHPDGHSAVLVQHDVGLTVESPQDSLRVPPGRFSLVGFDAEGRTTRDTPVALPTFPRRDDYGAVAIDSTHNFVVVTGIVSGSFSADGTSIELPGGQPSMVIMHFSPDGGLNWYDIFPIERSGHCEHIAVSSADRVAIACDIDRQMMLAVYEPDGTPVFKKTYGGIGHNGINSPVNALAWHADALLAVQGVTNRPFEGDIDAEPIDVQGGQDVFAAVYGANDGQHIWSTLIGGGSDSSNDFPEAGAGIVFDAAGNVYISGQVVGNVRLGGDLIEAEYRSVPTAFLASWEPQSGALRWVEVGPEYSSGGPVAWDAERGISWVNTTGVPTPGTLSDRQIHTQIDYFSVQDGLKRATVPLGERLVGSNYQTHFDGSGFLYTTTRLNDVIPQDSALVNELELNLQEGRNDLIERFSLPILVP